MTKLDFMAPAGWDLFLWYPEMAIPVTVHGLKDKRWGRGTWEFIAVCADGTERGPVTFRDLVYSQRPWK